jgi:hypothetical protein
MHLGFDGEPLPLAIKKCMFPDSRLPLPMPIAVGHFNLRQKHFSLSPNRLRNKRGLYNGLRADILASKLRENFNNTEGYIR